MTYPSLIKHDYKSRADDYGWPARRRIRGHHWLLIGFAVAIVGSLAVNLPHRADATVSAVPAAHTGQPADSQGSEGRTPITKVLALPDSATPPARARAATTAPAQPPAKAIKVSTAAPATAAAAATEPASGQGSPTLVWHEVTIRKGDSLAKIFSRVGLTAKDVHRIISLGGPAKQLKRIHPGEKLQIGLDGSGKLTEFVYHKDVTHGIRVQREGDDFQVTAISREPERRPASASGVIRDSLFLAGQQAGLSENLIMELAGIFGWDIDFVLDIRKGDQFTVLYDELYLDGRKIGDGHIIAAEFINRGRTYQAVRYTDPSGRTDYYAPDGRSMRKAFLRTPVNFTRISSRFTLKRKHPLLNKIRAHKGVDYAAPTGTPVKAAGDGKVVFRGRKGGYGRAVILQHGSRYSTLYGHLSRFGKYRTGQRVRQGQIIGYVGSSGLATGPHLHYEFRVNGVHRNPLTVKLPDAAPLDKRYRQDFLAKAQPLLEKLARVRDPDTRVALQVAE